MTSRSGKITVLVPAPRMTTGFAPIWLVKALGYDTAEGIAVGFDLAGSGSPRSAVEAVVAGRGDMTFVNIVFPLLGLDRDVRLLPFYGFVRKQNRSFSVLRESSIRTLNALKDRVVGLHFDDPQLTEFAEAVLVGAGLDPGRDVRLVPLPGSPLDAARMAAALRDGKVDAVWQLDIFTGLMAAEGVALRHLPATSDALSPSSTLVAMQQSLERRGELFGAMGRAVAKATVFVMSNPEAAIRLVWREFPGSRPQQAEDAEQAWRRELAALKVRLEGQRIDDQRVKKWGAITAVEIEGWLGFLRKSGTVSGRLVAPDCFHDALVPDFNAFDAEEVAREARNWPALG